MLLGPTASGKSSLSLKLAQQFPLEIISIDSALIYKGLDIGTAKPTLAEQTRVPHHLIDIIDPRQSYSTAQFVIDCSRLIEQIRARKRIPLIVGGTMLYARALLQGLDALPEADPEVRAQIDSDAAQRGWPQLHKELELIDPITAARLAPNDAQRIQRALEVFRLTGQPLSSLFGKPSHLPVPLTVIGLTVANRKDLHARIAQRFAQMLEAGFIEEVKQLRTRSDLHIGLPAIRSVGYRQAWEHLDGQYNFAEFQERGIVATRQLAKRQMTWLRTFGRYTQHYVEFDFADPALERHCVAACEQWHTQQVLNS
jgi:tRNA dimethylallyltransferase